MNFAHLNQQVQEAASPLPTVPFFTDIDMDLLWVRDFAHYRAAIAQTHADALIEQTLFGDVEVTDDHAEFWLAAADVAAERAEVAVW